VIATGEVTTLARSPKEWGSRDGIGADARFNGPTGITIDGAGNLFVADGSTFRKVVMATGEVTTFAGEEWGSNDGTGTAARFDYLQGIVSDGAGNLFVADNYNHAIRKIVVRTQTVTTVVGSPDRMGVVLGPLPAGLSEPWGLALGPAGELLISDSAENAILAVKL
jgi:streptogramin lyase